MPHRTPPPRLTISHYTPFLFYFHSFPSFFVQNLMQAGGEPAGDDDDDEDDDGEAGAQSPSSPTD